MKRFVLLFLLMAAASTVHAQVGHVFTCAGFYESTDPASLVRVAIEESLENADGLDNAYEDFTYQWVIEVINCDRADAVYVEFKPYDVDSPLVTDKPALIWRGRYHVNPADDQKMISAMVSYTLGQMVREIRAYARSQGLIADVIKS